MVHFASQKTKSPSLKPKDIKLRGLHLNAKWQNKPKKTRTKSNKVMSQTRGGFRGLEEPDPTLENGQTLRFKTSRNKVTTVLLALQPSPLLAHACQEGQGSPR